MTDRRLQDGSFEQRRRYFDRFDTVCVATGTRFATLHFAGPNGWDDTPARQALVAILAAPPAGRRLWNLPGVDVVAYCSAEREVALRSPRGSARIVERNGVSGSQYCYVPVPDDVLGYTADPDLAAFVAAGFHDSRAWLNATADQACPDVVPHLGALLRSPRCGQVILFAADGYTFSPEAGGHGGLRRDERRIAMMFAGPGIPAGGTLEAARAVDLVPTLLNLLGFAAQQDDRLEGLPLFSAAADESLSPAQSP